MAAYTRNVRFLLLAGLAACGDPAGPSATAPGSAIVHVAFSGSATVPTPSYRLLLDDSTVYASTAADSLLLGEIRGGAHAITLLPLDPRCVPDWYVPQPVTISARHPAQVTFAVRCDAAPAPGIVFASTRDSPSRRNIYRMDSTGGNVQLLSSSGLSEDFPVVSPGGTRVAFQHYAANGVSAIWLMNADGSGAVKLSGSSLLEESPSWSPDGRSLAFIRWTTGDLRSLIIATPDGRAERTLIEGLVSDGTAPRTPAWSPDGRSIAYGRWFASRVGIQVMDVATKATTDFLPANDSLEALPLTWSPGGDLLYCRFRRQPGALCDAVVSPVSGASELVLAPAVSGLVTAAYSSDGATIALTAYGPGGVFDVFVMPSSGGSMTNLTNSPLIQDLFPSWIP